MEEQINTNIVYGFLESGKTSYIENCIFHDFFHKRGSTLILSFEEGEEEYHIEKLKQYRTDVVYYDGESDIQQFCQDAIETYQPGKIYVEMNAMMDELKNQLPSCMKTVFTITLVDGTTLPLYFNNMRQWLQNMIIESNMVIFNRCEDKEMLSSYATAFRLMNQKAAYLRKSTLGYSEKAFGNYIPYDLTQSQLIIPDSHYAIWFLDSNENPTNYENKIVEIDGQIEYRNDFESPNFFIGRRVMTCCVMDIQNLGYECINESNVTLANNTWIHLKAKMVLKENQYHVKRIALQLTQYEIIPMPKQMVIGINT